MKVIWTPNSRANLDSIYSYIAYNSERYAIATVDRLTSRARQLESFPYSGHVVPEYGREAIRQILMGSYRMIYKIEGSQVFILAVLHGSRFLPEDPQDL